MKKFTCIDDGEAKVDGVIDGTKEQSLARMEKTAEDVVAEKGGIGDREMIVFKSKAAILKGLNIRQGDGSLYENWWKGGFPIGPSRILWFPHLSFQAGGWNNLLSPDGKVITESRGTGQSDTDRKQRKIAKRDWLPDVEKMRRGQPVERCVFAHSKNALGESGYRFLGVYKLVDAEINRGDGLPEKMIFKKCEDYMNTLPDGSTYYRG